MEKEILLAKIEPKIKNLTVLNADATYKFGIGLPEEERIKRQPQSFRPKPYNIKKDQRIKDLLISRPGAIQNGQIADAMITMFLGLSFEESHYITDDQVDKLLSQTGLKDSDMNAFTKFVEQLPGYMRCQKDLNRPEILILMRLVFEAARVKNCPFHSEDVLKKLQNALVYLRENKIIMDRLEIGLETKPYEEFLSYYTVQASRQHVIVKEMDKIQPFFKQEEKYLGEVYDRETAKLNQRIKERCKNKTVNVLIQSTVTPEDRISQIENASEELWKKYELRIKKLDKYMDKIGAYASSIVSDTIKTCTKHKIDPILVAESAIWAIAYGDEMWKSPLCRMPFLYLNDKLGNRLAVPSLSPTIRNQLEPYLARRREWQPERHFERIFDLDTVFEYREPVPENTPAELDKCRSYGHISSLISTLANRSIGTEFKIRQSDIDIFRAVGVSKAKSREYAIITEMLRDFPAKDSYFFMTDTEEQDEDDIVSECESKIKKLESSYAVLEAKNEALERTKNNLEKENKAKRHDLEELRRENEKLRNQLEAADSEIKKRDELINAMEQAEDETEIAVEESIFPYRTNKKVIILGGFDSFHQEIKKFLPDVRTIPPAIHFDWGPIRSADIVFLQTNKMKHSCYYAAIDAAKNAGTQYMHLNNASAKVCAAQIVEKLEQMEKNV